MRASYVISRWCSAPLLAAATFACGGDGTTGPRDQVPGEVVERRVDPAATGAGIANTTGQHLVLLPAASTRLRELLVFLPGTGGRPEFYASFLRHAAERGHHVIGLAYPNEDAVNDLCPLAPSPTCHEDVRTEIITGAPRSTLVNVDAANSIDGRLRSVLVWLDRNVAREGWSDFLEEGEPRWDRVATAGHSQGGGHAAMIARLRVLRRAILFSSTEPAPWTLATFATPASRLYGFVHHRETAYTAITTSWDRMQFSGLLTTVDGASPPFGGSHRLETNVDTCRAVAVLDTFHNCVVVDAVTPLDGSGRPVFESVWTYLIGG